MLKTRLLIAGFALAAGLADLPAAEATRTLRQEIALEPGRPVWVENLAGTMRIHPGNTARMVAVVTVHAESEALAGSVRFEPARDPRGHAGLRVEYPLDRHTTFRYPGEGGKGSWHGLGGGGSRIEYAGSRVTVSGTSGVTVYADLDIEIPATASTVTFRNHVGKILAEEVNGTLKFDSASGGIVLARVKGNLTADTGSGDVEASDIDGSLSCDTGSGDINVVRFQGEVLSGDVGSGDINVRDVRARKFSADTGSGDVRVREADLEAFQADTGSGEVALENRGTRLKEIDVDTGSGDVSLRLDPASNFEVLTDQGSGDTHMGFRDAEPILKHREVIGYRRGGSGIRIKVSTGSGDLEVNPAS